MVGPSCQRNEISGLCVSARLRHGRQCCVGACGYLGLVVFVWEGVMVGGRGDLRDGFFEQLNELFRGQHSATQRDCACHDGARDA